MEEKKTILVFGGSQGARTINETFCSVMESLPAVTPWQAIHITGREGSQALKARYARLSFPVFVSEYQENMADVYSLADIVIGRSGAGTVTELGLLGIPAILIPYPHANNHQYENARVLERQKTGAIIQEKDLKADILRDKIFSGMEQSSSREENRKRLKDDFTADALGLLVPEIEQLVRVPS